MKRTDLTRLSVRLDRHLNQFALAANAQGEYPWQQAQRERRNKRMGAAAVGGAGIAGIAAAGYGVKKGVDALKSRYGVASGMDALKVGAYEGAQKVGDYAKQGYGIAKDKVGALANRAGAYGQNVAGAYQGARQGAMVMGKVTGGMGKRAAIMAALRKVRFSSAERLVQLEGVLDEALTELGRGYQDDTKDDDKAAKIAGRFAHKKAALITTGGVAALGADRAIMNRARNKHGDLSRPNVTRATAYGEGLTDAMKSGKRMAAKAKVYAGYHAEPLVRKAKDLMGLRKVGGLLK